MSGAPDMLDRLQALGALSQLDVHFAKAVSRMGGETDGAVTLAVALASRQSAQGHVCLDLHRLGTLVQTLAALEAGNGAPGTEEESGAQPVSLPWPPIDEWLERLVRSPLVSSGGADHPMVLDGQGRLYMSRHHGQERRVGQFVQARIGQGAGVVDRGWLEAGLDRYFGARDAGPSAAAAVRRKGRGAQPSGDQLSFLGALEEQSGQPRAGAQPDGQQPDLQRLAAQTAVERNFCVISGGPGTGKTSTVVKILALLVEQCFATGKPAPRMHLMAPTGKAAARLTESIKQAKARLPCPDDVKGAIVEQAGTIHRALGTQRHAEGFRHDRDTPLLTDLVLVDEASMVDLALMAHLFDAIPLGARVILLGDKNQLASVEAGAVLGDLCGAGRLQGDRARPPMAAAIVHLTRSYRYASDSGIGLLAEAVNGGDSRRALSLLADGSLPDVELQAPSQGDGLGPALAGCILQGLDAYLRATEPLERLKAFEGFRVLCAHRRGPNGIEWINPRIEQLLLSGGLLPEAGGNYDLRPVMVTRNDYQAQLFNGDVGVVCREGRSARVHFAHADGTRSVPASRLPVHETAFAMSVHKSQGSEFDHVLLVLPPLASPVLTRELLYTAITRAKKRVTLVGTPALIETAIATRVERVSGLGNMLWG